ncbi:hypothetical protein KY312_03865, partial [Candidatus Woesearchaeota archaeon]|nr:hypothetical protein [Candidatus Woesearchaeota archaeon]
LRKIVRDLLQGKKGNSYKYSDYAFKNFKKLRYQSLWWKDGEIEAVKKPNRPNKDGKYLVIVVARGFEAVVELIKEDGF